MHQTIQALRPNVTREEAEVAFGPRHFHGLMARIRMGKLRSLADVYLPFQIFRVNINNGGKRDERFFGIDALSGTLDLYTFAAEPEELLAIHTRNVPSARIQPEILTPLLKTKVQRALFQTGFFKMRQLSLSVEPLSTVHVPYWVALYGAEDDLRMRVMDAVRRQMEGAKVRELIRQWLQE